MECIETVNPQALRPHPCNNLIYGTDESVEDLKEKIAASGWIKTLVVTQHNVIISGHRRWRVALELGMDVPIERRSFANETDELEALLLENHSREKTIEQKVREGETWKKIETDRAHERKLAPLSQYNSTGSKPLDYLAVVENFPPRQSGKARDAVAEKVGFGSGRTYEKAATVVATADKLKAQGKVEESKALLKVLNEQSVDAASRVLKLPEPEQVATLEMLATRQAKDIKEAKALHKRSVLAEMGLSVVLPQHLQLLHGDFMTVGSQIADNSVSLIFTDPPYHEKHLDLWSDLGQFAARVLKPGGLLVAYSGQAFLFSVLSRLSEHLDYRWMLSTYHCGQHIQIWKDQLWNEWKPLVLFSKGKPLEHEWLKDAYTGPKGDKAAHEWAQGEDEADYFIHSLSRPGDLVVDPMCGSGTIIRMAHRLKRRAIGIEIDKQRCDVARGTMQDLEEYEEEIA